MQNELNALGPYPILQLAGALVVLGGICFAVWRAIRDNKSSPAPTSAPIVAIGGALAERDLAERHMSTLHELKDSINRLARVGERMIDEGTTIGFDRDTKDSIDRLASRVEDLAAEKRRRR